MARLRRAGGLFGSRADSCHHPDPPGRCSALGISQASRAPTRRVGGARGAVASGGRAGGARVTREAHRGNCRTAPPLHWLARHHERTPPVGTVRIVPRSTRRPARLFSDDWWPCPDRPHRAEAAAARGAEAVVACGSAIRLLLLRPVCFHAVRAARRRPGAGALQQRLRPQAPEHAPGTRSRGLSRPALRPRERLKCATRPRARRPL